MASGLPVFMGDVPDYEVRNGRMHVTLKDFEIVLPLQVFMQGAARAQAAIDRWNAEQHGAVVQFPAPDHAASS